MCCCVKCYGSYIETIKIQMSTQDYSHNNVWDIRRCCGFLSKHSWIPGLCVRGPALFHLTTFSLLHQIQAPPELGSGATGAGVWELYPWASGCSKNSSTTWAVCKNSWFQHLLSSKLGPTGFLPLNLPSSRNDISYSHVIRIYIYTHTYICAYIYTHISSEYIYMYYSDLRIISKTVLLVGSKPSLQVFSENWKALREHRLCQLPEFITAQERCKWFTAINTTNSLETEFSECVIHPYIHITESLFLWFRCSWDPIDTSCCSPPPKSPVQLEFAQFGCCTSSKSSYECLVASEFESDGWLSMVFRQKTHNIS